MTKFDKIVQCNLCKKEYVYGTGTGNFWLHLQNKHGIINPASKVLLNTEMAERRSQQQSIDTMFKQQKTYEKSSKKHQDITLKLAKLFIKEMLPLNKVESDSWRELFTEMDSR